MEIGQKIRRLRKLRGLTIEDVAEKADLTKGFISQLERDLSIPTVTTLKQILDVLGVSLSAFFSDISEREKNIYTVKDRILDNQGKQFRIDNLIPKMKYLEMEPKLLTLQANGIYKTEFEEDEGFGFVVKGKVDVTVGPENKILSKGDCFYIFFDNKLIIKNLSTKVSEVLLVSY
ncbi:MAG: XRE family transcriptional regulator [Calditrichia bacterium]